MGSLYKVTKYLHNRTLTRLSTWKNSKKIKYTTRNLTSRQTRNTCTRRDERNISDSWTLTGGNHLASVVGPVVDGAREGLRVALQGRRFPPPGALQLVRDPQHWGDCLAPRHTHKHTRHASTSISKGGRKKTGVRLRRVAGLLL